MKAVCIIFLLFPWAAFAQQPAVISGHIKDADTGEALVSANVGLVNTPKGTSTDSLGFYRIDQIKPGKYTLVVSYVGFKTWNKEIALSSGQHLKLDIQLKPNSHRLKALLVTTNSQKDLKSNSSFEEIRPAFIKKVPAVFAADVFRSLQLLPGVKAASEISSGLYIRGGSPDQTLILLNGTPVYNPTHFFGFFSIFNPDAVQNIHLYKGAYPAKYGGRLGSVLAIHNKHGNPNKFGGTATIGLLASRAEFDGPLKKGSWMIALRRSTLDPILAIMRGSIDHIPNAFSFYDINGSINIKASANNQLSLALYAGRDNVDYPIAADARAKLLYGNQTFSASWKHSFSDRISSNLVLSGSRYFDFPSFHIAGTTFKRTNKVLDFSVKENVQYHPNSHQTFSAGFAAGRLMLKHKDRFQEMAGFSLPIQSWYGSFYVQDEWMISKRWTLTPGLRINWFEKGSYWRINPRFSVEYKPAPAAHFQLSYGRYDQFLTQSSNSAFSGGFTTWFTSDKGVEPEYSNQFVAKVQITPRKGYDINVAGYYRTMKDLFQLNPFLPDKSGLGYPQLFRFGQGYAYGVEVSVKKQIGRLTGMLGYTFSVTRRKFPNFNYPIGQPGQARFFPPKYDRRHDVKAVISYQWSPRWKATAVFKYATGQAYTKVLGRTAAIDLPTRGTGIDQLVVGKVNASRLPAYHRLDVGFTRSGTFFSLAKAKWKFQLINVYSHRNVWFYEYDFDKNPVKRKTVKLLPILPNISYTISF